MKQDQVLNSCKWKYYNIELDFFQLQTKMLKKAKIVNISLNSPKNIVTPPIHLWREKDDEHLDSLNDAKMELILKHCIEAINLICTQKKQNLEKERKLTKTLTEGLKEAKKTDKQTGIKLPLDITNSIETILKKFIFIQMQENQQKMKSSYSRQKKSQQSSVKMYKTLLMRSNKQTNQNDNSKSIQVQNQMFQCSSKIDKDYQKLLNKMYALQTQVLFYKEKLNEKINLISKLQNKENLMKKKFQADIQKIMRYKNIININSIFQKEYKQKEEGKYIMNVTGKNISLKKELHSLGASQSSINRSSQVILHEQTKTMTGKLKKRALKTSPTEPLLKAIGRNLQLQNNKRRNIQLSINSSETSMKNDSSKIQSSNKKFVSRVDILKQQLDEFYKQKQKTIENFNQNSNKLQKYIQDLDSKILQKMRQISVQQELITDQELRMLKQEDFQTLQLRGFYDGSQTLLNQNFQ